MTTPQQHTDDKLCLQFLSFSMVKFSELEKVAAQDADHVCDAKVMRK